MTLWQAKGFPIQVCKRLAFLAKRVGPLSRNFWAICFGPSHAIFRRTILGSSRGPCYQRDLPMQGIFLLVDFSVNFLLIFDDCLLISVNLW